MATRIYRGRGFNRARKLESGYAMILAIASMAVVTISLALYENSLLASLDASKQASGKVQADWACYGSAVRAAASPPDALTRYDYYGTRVQLTVHDPPLSLLHILLESAGSEITAPTAEVEGLRMFCAVAAAPTPDSSSAESTWYFLIQDATHPIIAAAWPGIERNNPYE